MTDLKTKSIAIIIPDFDYGGEEHRAVFFANNYLNYFKRVYLIAPDGQSTIKLLPEVIHVRKNVRNIKNISSVLKFLKQEKIDFLQGHKRATLPYLFLAEKRLKINSLFNFDNIYLKHNRICSYITPTNIAYLSDVLKDFYHKYYLFSRFNNVTINMGGSFFQEQSADKKVETRRLLGIDNTFVVLSLGRLDTQKNHKLLLLALSKLQHRNFVCLVVGDGPLKNELFAQCDKLNLSDKVKFLGHRTDIENILNASDILVQSSIFEGFPNVFIEAASVSLPIVATNVGSSRTLIKKNGVLINSNDVNALVTAIEAVMDNYLSYKDSAIAMKNSDFLKQFTRENMLANYIHFYQNIQK